MIPKQQPIRSKKLRESARGEDCTLRLPGCDGGGETTVLAHLPFGDRGIGRKASDIHACWACANCHDILDGRKSLTGSTCTSHDEQDRELIYEQCLRAHAETLQSWVDAGLITVKGAKA